MTHQIRRTSARYELLVDDVVAAVADYRVTDGVTVLPHVETDWAFRGQGLATELVTGVLDGIRADGGRVLPLCPFVGAFVRANPSYADLVER